MADTKPSSNRLPLKKHLPSKKRKHNESGAPSAAKKPRKEDSTETGRQSPSHLSASLKPSASHSEPSGSQGKEKLRQMVLGQLEYSDAQQKAGKYLALDCEMVGVGTDGSESSLARVSLVNYYGAVLLDEYVRQRERVVDYRTKWSGIRPKDLVNAQPFGVVQEQVANLLKNKILVGHALYNDLKALLLSHPRPMTRDTQYYTHKFGVCKSSRVALRDLVKQELELTIQSGEHSSVTDARAAMAVYRLHQKTWERGVPRNVQSPTPSGSKKPKANTSSFGNSKKGVKSSRGGKYIPKEPKREGCATHKFEWWAQLPDSDQHLVERAASVSDWTYGFQEWPDTD